MRHLILCTALLSLAACTQPGGQPPGGEPPVITPDTVEIKPSKPKVTRKPKITTAQLLGQSDAWLLAKLGDPTFKRTDMPANLWQYKNGQCVLNVFLYTDTDAKIAPDTPAHVLHFDARDTHGLDTDRDACLSALQD